MQQVQTEILGAGAYGTALREAAREAAQTEKLPVADIYWYQGVLPALQQLGASEDFMQRKYAELQQQEQEWRFYGMPGDFADWLWKRGWTLYQ
jgi:glycerol-3-phosphate dehydrogenase